MFSGGETLDDRHLIQLTEVVGPLLEEMFCAWRRGSRYFESSSKRIYGAEDEEVLDRGLSSPGETYDSDDGGSELGDSDSTLFDNNAGSAEDILASIQLNIPLEAMYFKKRLEDSINSEEQ
ncbi:hypothetical protein KVR01_011539 [Diaporthe batatas]|uniref:uncharacterized protein n=1 Tax=Diaporthe batatas TaxID=748121 RepID=UPI001D036998|nr:uncharacterized protein KVR01_011539 [Diaporthe batatas]KAG8158417.1 hypothetical protein KVR01_011539 [Diaporthe batatas]